MVQSTIERHQRELNKYRNYLETYGNKTIETAKKKDVLQYLKHVKETRNLSNATQSQVLNILKNQYKYLAEYYEVLNPTVLLKIRGIKRKQLRPVFNDEQLKSLCECYEDHIQNYMPTNKELRFYPDFYNLLTGRYLALTLIAYQGMQAAEVLVLTAESFDLRKATLKVHASKRGASRTLKLQATQMGSLIRYLGQGNTQILPNNNQLEHLGNTLKSLTKKEEHPFLDFRQLRASRITYWIKTAGLRKAQYLAGHKNINTTETYKDNDFEQLKQSLERFHPLK